MSEELPEEVRDYFRRVGRKGGLLSAAARMKKLTPAKRKRVAKQAARARWTKEKKGNDG